MNRPSTLEDFFEEARIRRNSQEEYGRRNSSEAFIFNLKGEIEILRNALQEISQHHISCEESAFRMQEIARKALK